MNRVLSAALLVVCLAVGTLAQTNDLPRFDVASIKQNTTCPGGPQTFQWSPSGRWTATCMPIGRVIQAAYADYQLRFEGLPDWARFERYDIAANVPGEVPAWTADSVGPINLMIRMLLAERLKLAMHLEDRPTQVYVLTFARTDRQRGGRLGSAVPDCPLAEGTLAEGACGPGRVVSNVVGSKAIVKYGNTTLANLAQQLSPSVGRRVIDETGVVAGQSVDLDWVVQGNATAQPGAAPALLPEGPSLFTAIQEQLGLRLQSAERPVPIVVIEHIERPTAD